MFTIALETVVYLCLGLVLMMLGYWVIDLCIPLDFPKEINEGNKAVGWVSAGIYAGLGYILRCAIAGGSSLSAVGLVMEALDTAVFSVIGIISLIVAYFVVDIVNKKFNFNTALKEKNEAAGIMVFGIFIGIAFLVSGVIQ